MREMFSSSASGHQITPPQSLHDLAEGLHHEARELVAHRDGTAAAAVKGLKLIQQGGDFVELVPGAVAHGATVAVKSSFAAAHARYIAAMNEAVRAVKDMQYDIDAMHDDVMQAIVISKMPSHSSARH